MMNIPEDIQKTASKTKKLVYLYLERVKSASIDEMCDSLGVKRLELYPILSSLKEMDYVEQDGDSFVLNA